MGGILVVQPFQFNHTNTHDFFVKFQDVTADFCVHAMLHNHDTIINPRLEFNRMHHNTVLHQISCLLMFEMVKKFANHENRIIFWPALQIALLICHDF